MSILIGMPCYSGLVSDKTVNGLFALGKLFVRNGVDHGFLTIANESIITQGRSRIANFFMNNTEFEYLFFLDADVGFEAADVLKLYQHQQQIVSGAYPMKTLPLKWNFTLTEPRQTQNSLIAIDSIGLGFCLIHRSVFSQIIAKQGDELKYVPHGRDGLSDKEIANSYHFFSEIKIGDTLLGEDISFFRRAKVSGVQSWLDTSINLCHVGSYVFQE